MNQNTLIVNLKTANEFGVWTGGVESGKMDAVNASSLVGSLRFWTGCYLRAEGQRVCNTTGCTHSKESMACSLCTIFGCTGLCRSFSFSLSTADTVNLKNDRPIPPVALVNFKSPRNGKPPRYYERKGYCGPLTLTFSVKRPDIETNSYALSKKMISSLVLMIRYGTIGAYDQYGCGLVDFASTQDEKMLVERCEPTISTGQPQKNLSLQDFFFFKGKVQKPSREVPFLIRHSIRDAIRNNIKSADVRHFFCGALGQANSKYTLSMDGKGNLYGWGYFDRVHYNEERETVITLARSEIEKAVGKSLVWRECNSARDTVKKLEWSQFYSDLLASPWRN